MGVNELRETFHHWVRTVALPIEARNLGEPLSYCRPSAGATNERAMASDANSMILAREVWDDIDADVRAWLTQYREKLTQTLLRELKDAGVDARAREKEAFDLRIKEVSSLQSNQNIEKLKREIEEHRATYLQYALFEDADERAERELRDLQDELKRRQSQFGDLLIRLQEEKERILERVLPGRFTLRGGAQVFPVTIEIRLPEAGQ